MEGKTAQRFNREVQKKTETADKTKLVGNNGLQNHASKSSNSWMDKLFQNGQYEKSPNENRRTPTDANENCDMEAVEDKRKTRMGTSETRSTYVDGETVRRFW